MLVFLEKTGNQQKFIQRTSATEAVRSLQADWLSHPETQEVTWVDWWPGREEIIQLKVNMFDWFSKYISWYK